MISLRLALGRLEDRRLPNRRCPQKAADVLGADLNRSESRWSASVAMTANGISARSLETVHFGPEYCGRASFL